MAWLDWTREHLLEIVIIILIIVLMVMTSEKKCGMSESMANINSQISVDAHRIGKDDVDVYTPRDLREAARYRKPYFIGPNGASVGTIDALEPSDQDISNSVCSKSCCGNVVHPPFELPDDKYFANSKTKYFESNYQCQNEFTGSGCLCLTEAQSQYMNQRADNSACGSIY